MKWVLNVYHFHLLHRWDDMCHVVWLNDTKHNQVLAVCVLINSPSDRPSIDTDTPLEWATGLSRSAELNDK